jgi:hypothetical protein
MAKFGRYTVLHIHLYIYTYTMNLKQKQESTKVRSKYGTSRCCNVGTVFCIGFNYSEVFRDVIVRM